MSSDNTSDDVNKLVESNISAVPSKLIGFPCPEYTFMIFPTKSYSSELHEFFVIVASASFFTDRLEFIPESNLH